jgi:disulfide bond formation protein DsbB
MLDLSPRQTFLAIGLAALATIAGAWMFEYLGYLPCELCLKQRWLYYTAIPVAGFFYGASGAGRTIVQAGFLVLAALWLGSMIFGIYHSGVEWKWWAGPSSCTGTGGLTGGLPDLTKPVVMCDTPALRILGLSLAGWNAVISLVLMTLALRGLRRV